VLPRSARVPTAGVVTAPIADLRRRPDHASELLNQALFGETVRVRALSPDRKWLRVESGADGDSGWLRAWSVALGPPAAARRWRLAAGHMVDRPWSSPTSGALPFGARVARVRGGFQGPLGPLTLPASALALVPARPRRAATLVSTARRFLGVAYHWGGRSPAGLDCSGLVQLAAARNGILLPRDAREQCAALGGPRALRPLPEGARPGDLWFFGPDRRTVTHVAIATGGLGLVHAYGWVREGSLDPEAEIFEPELFRWSLGCVSISGYAGSRTR
jgi:cell wall-associated NlpC family hydrolase